MKFQRIKDNIQKRLEKSAWTLSGLKAYERVRVELVIWAFMFCTGGLGLVTEIIFTHFTFRFYSYLFLMGIALLSFLGKSVQFRQFYMLNKIKEMQK